MPPKSKRKGLDSSADLPGLFPTHDGSYGINTLINTDVEVKKGNKSSTSIAREQLDDQKWVNSMKSRASKKYGMNSNLKKAIDESQKEVEEEEHQEASPSPQAAAYLLGMYSNTGESGILEPPDDSGAMPKFAPHVPNYSSNDLPFREEDSGKRQPPYTQVELPSDNPYSHHGSSPPENVSFYGLPQGAGSNHPISPTRPDTSRSFNFESEVFANATLRTPGPSGSLFGASQPATQGWGLPPQGRATGQFGLAGDTGAGVLPAGKPTSSTQPNLQGQPTPRRSTSGREPFISRQSVPGTQSNLQGQPTPAPPSSSRAPSTEGQPSADTQAKLQAHPHRNRQAAPLSPPDSSEVQIPAETRSKAESDKTTETASSKNRWRGLPLPSLSLVFRATLMFFAITFLIWIPLALIPDNLDYITSVARAYFPPQDLGIGAMWNKLAEFLPEYRYPHPTPNRSGPLINSGMTFNEILNDLNEKMPESIWVRKDKSGKMKIPEDLWHALRDLIRADESILSLENSNISEDNWFAIKSRLQSAGFVDGPSSEGTENLGKKMSQVWDSWVRENEYALKQAITGVALKKEDFMKLFQQELGSYKHEISHELWTLQGQIKDITQQMSKLRDELSTAGSLTREGITKNYDPLVSRILRAVKLDAVAQGLIRGHVNDVLANEVNFFAIGAGAAIDPSSSSDKWKVPKDFYKRKRWLDKDGYRAQPRTAAVSPWTQEGECFCAAPNRNDYGNATNSVGVLLSRYIVPQHFVVEHILPGATLDPGAMPKEIEVWAYIEEVALRNAVLAFSAKQFTLTPLGLLNDGFVKIGHFTYKNKNTGDGIQVFKLSGELERMGFMTAQVAIRAINNYGADHTCFYRLRLYGHVIDRPGDEPIL
ncbi:hypothetical protein F4802DRAFT_604735 [Xylaria palmicola]|nr:hypothetical protein F4802DRAFT_604735 [Xylaria palmicola]